MSLFRSLPLQEKINFARHLSIMIKAGLPLFDGLKILRKQARKRTLQKILDGVIVDVGNGKSLADSLKVNGLDVFGDFFVSIVEVGEASGTLSENLLYLAEEMRRSKAIKGKVRSAMIYPIVLVVMTVLISSFLTFYVFPKILPLFNSMNVELPATTRGMIAVLTFLRAYGLWVLGGFLGIIVFTKLILRIEAFRYIWDYQKLYIPAISQLIVGVNMANFTRVLGVLLKSGVRIVEAVQIVSHTLDNAVYKRSLLRVVEEIRKGGTLAQYLVVQNKLFPPLLSALIEVGENTGTLEENLFYISEYYTDEVDTYLKNVTALMEPVLLMVMGIVVGFVALSIITPIYSITQSVGG